MDVWKGVLKFVQVGGAVVERDRGIVEIGDIARSGSRLGRMDGFVASAW